MKIASIFFVMVLVLGIVAADDTDSTYSSVLKLSLLNQDPNPARAGDTVDLRFKLENRGGVPVNNLQIELVQDYPYTVINGAPILKIDTIDAYQTGINYLFFQYALKIDKDAEQGQKELKLRYNYGSSSWVTVSFSVNIKNKEFAQIIYIDKAKIDPGKETDLKFTINNVGNAPLQNMIFSWQEPNGVILPVYSGDTKYIKYLDVGQSVDLDYKVIADVNAKPGLYQLNLNLKSESLSNANSSLVITTKAGIFVGGETDFDVTFSESTQGQTSLSIANTGNNPAMSVSVKIPQQDNFRVTGSNSAIVGNLDKGDYTIVSFQIAVPNLNSSNFRRQGSPQNQQTNQQFQQRINETRNNANNLMVEIDYTDTTGERRNVEKLVPIQFRPATSLTNGRTQQTSSGFIGSKTFWILLAIIAVIIFFVFRDKKRKDKIFAMLKRKK